MRNSLFTLSRLAIIACALILIASFALSFVSPAYAATITVNSTADNVIAGDGACTLREAINNANADSDTTGGDCAAGSGADVITFGVTGTITLLLGQLEVNQTGIANTLTIDGGTVGNIVINGNNNSRVFLVGNSGSNDGFARGLILRDLIIENGNGTGNFGGSANPNGGCLYLGPNSQLETYATVFRNCRAEGAGGAIYADGGTAGTSGTSMLLTERTTIRNNRAARGGGVYVTTGELSVNGDACIRNNEAVGINNGSGGGIYIAKDSVLMLGGGSASNRAFVIGNSARGGAGGGVYLDQNASMTGDHARFFSNLITSDGSQTSGVVSLGTGSAWYAVGGDTGTHPLANGRSCTNCCVVDNRGFYAVYQDVNVFDADWRNNWWGNDWGPLMYDLDPSQSGAPQFGSNVSNGDGISTATTPSPGISAINVGLVDPSDWNGVPSGAWLLQSTAPSDCQNITCTGSSSVGQVRTCSNVPSCGLPF